MQRGYIMNNPRPQLSIDPLYVLREEVRILTDAVSGWQDTCIQLQAHVQNLIDKDKAREREIKALSGIILRDEAMALVLDYAPQLKKRLLGIVKEEKKK
jgi:hypothetical protein